MNFNIPGFNGEKANYAVTYDLEAIKDRLDDIISADMGADWAAKFSEGPDIIGEEMRNVPTASEIGRKLVPSAAETPPPAESVEVPEENNVINVDFARRRVDDALGGGRQ